MRRLAGPLLFLTLAAAFPFLALRPQERPVPRRAGQISVDLRPKQLARFRESLARRRAHGKDDLLARRWVRAIVRSGDERRHGKIRLRGDNPNHWAREKVSLRVRLGRDQLLERAREFHLIVPHDRGYFHEMIAEWWNRRLGLVPCRADLRWVESNGEPWGIYAYVEALGKEQLEREGQAVGPIFRSYARRTRRLPPSYANRRLVYSLPYFQQVVREAPDEGPAAALFAELLALFRERPAFDDEALRRAGHLLDLDKLAAFSALSRLLGAHAAAPHNVVLRFNPASGLFEPIFQDPSGDGGTQPRTLATFEDPFFPESFSPFEHELLRLPAFHALRDRWLRRILDAEPEFLRWFTGLGAWVDELAQDPNLVAIGGGPRPTRDELLAYGGFFLRHYQSLFALIRAFLAEDARGAYDTARGAGQASLRDEPFSTLHLTIRRERQGARVTARHSLPGSLRLRALRADGAELTRWEGPGLELPPGVDTSFELPAAPPAVELEPVLVEAPELPFAPVSQHTDGRAVDLSFLDRSPAEAFARGSNIALRVEANRLVVPAGDHTVRELLVAPRGRPLVFEAGATLRFAPQAGLVSYAPIRVEGTASRPVVFDAQNPAEGWAGLRVQGVNAGAPTDPEGRRSLVQHARFARARTMSWGAITTTGGVSFFSSDVTLRRAVFYDVGGDDALNVKNADADIDECLFFANPSDAVDLDWCSGRVRRSAFLSSRGDGIDLSGARKLRIEGCLVVGSGDKGLSVGEASLAGVASTLVACNEIGIASKDRSAVASEGNAFLGNETSLTAYEKKPIFGPAELLSRGDAFWGTNVQVEPGSRIETQGDRLWDDAPVVERLQALADAETPAQAAAGLKAVELPSPWREVGALAAELLRVMR